MRMSVTSWLFKSRSFLGLHVQSIESFQQQFHAASCLAQLITTHSPPRLVLELAYLSPGARRQQPASSPEVLRALALKSMPVKTLRWEDGSYYHNESQGKSATAPTSTDLENRNPGHGALMKPPFPRHPLSTVTYVP